MDADGPYKSTWPGKTHRKAYPAISPTRPELSQAGRTVLVVGASTGIGHAITRNYARASPAKLIALGRRPEVLQEAVAKLKSHVPQGSATEVTGIPSDATSREQMSKLAAGTTVDVLVLNSVNPTMMEPLLESGTDKVWKKFEDNVRAPLYMTERFYRQKGHDKPKYLVYIATMTIHDWDMGGEIPAYQLTKNSCVCMLQQIAKDTPVEKMQIVSFHPSLILSESLRNVGLTEETYPWSDEELPGQYAVWASSPEAEFLHGRFTWCIWDVEELAMGEWRKKMEDDRWFLKVGVKGL